MTNEKRPRPRIPTAALLSCAAIGVAGGLMLAAANWMSTALFATVPFASVALGGLWLLPAVIALRLLRLPLAGILVGLLSGLVAAPFSGYGLGSVLTNVWWAFFAEVGFLILLYRRWWRWQHYLGVVAVTVVYPLSAAQSFGLEAMAPWVRVAFFALLLVSSAVATALGILIADAVARTGVGRRTRRPRVVPGPVPD